MALTCCWGKGKKMYEKTNNIRIKSDYERRDKFTKDETEVGNPEGIIAMKTTRTTTTMVK